MPRVAACRSDRTMKFCRATSALAISASLASCATYSDIRSEEPVGVQMVRGDPSRLADCLIDELQLASGQTLASYVSPDWRKTLDHQTVHVSENDGGMYIWDMALEPSPGGTRAELRSIKSMLGTPQAPAGIWRMIAKCGTQS